MTCRVRVEVNGTEYDKQVEPRLLLVHLLREELGLTGTHVGCETSLCGACTVLIDGQAVKSCTQLAVQADGASITTIEGLSDGTDLHPLQQAFWDLHGLQCGYCTPGMVLAAVDLLGKNLHPDEAEIRTALKGNICRCTGYQNIVAAVQQAAAQQSALRKASEAQQAAAAQQAAGDAGGE